MSARRIARAPRRGAAFPWGLLLALVAAGALLGLTPLFGGSPGFKADDFAEIEYVSRPGQAFADLTGACFGFAFRFPYWRPLPTFSLLADYRFFGTDPWGYHLADVLLHVLNGWLLFHLLKRTGCPGGAAGAAALFFVVCPAAQLSFTWVSARGGVQVTFWILLALLLHARVPDGRIPRAPAVALVVALATKESAAAFPFLAAGLDLLGGRRRRWQAYLPCVAVLGAYLLWRAWLFGSAVGGPGVVDRAVHAATPGGILALLGGLGRAVAAFLWTDPGSLLQILVVGVGVLLILSRPLRRGSVSARTCAGALLFAAAAIGPLGIALAGFERGLDGLRPFYLAVCGAFAGLAWMGRSAILLALVGLPMFLGATPVREGRAKERFCSEVHEAVLRAGRASAPEAPVLVDLPRRPLFDDGYFLWGLDRLHRPPFAPSFRRVAALAPLLDVLPEIDRRRWPRLFGALRVGSAPEGRAATVLPGPPLPAPARAPDLVRPVTGEQLRSVVEGLASPGIPVRGEPGAASPVLFLTGMGSTELTVEISAEKTIPLGSLLLASCGGPTTGIPLVFLLVNSLDLEASRTYFVVLADPDERLVEIEFDRSALPFLVDRLRLGPALGRR